MEQIALGNGLYLKPHKTGNGLRLHNVGKGLYLKPKEYGMKKKNFVVNLLSRELTNAEIIKYAQKLKIPNFRGLFMRNALPENGPRKNESAIVNLNDKDGPGTHWVAYKKNGNNVIYFDIFGNLRSPGDLVKYLGIKKIKYNHERFQDFDTFICGHLCLKFLNQ